MNIDIEKLSTLTVEELDSLSNDLDEERSRIMQLKRAVYKARLEALKGENAAVLIKLDATKAVLVKHLRPVLLVSEILKVVPYVLIGQTGRNECWERLDAALNDRDLQECRVLRVRVFACTVADGDAICRTVREVEKALTI